MTTELPKIETPKPTQFELHLVPDPDFIKQFGARVKKAGGEYSDIRGNATHRFVHVPLASPDAKPLINALIASNARWFVKSKPKVTVVLRGFDFPGLLPAHIVVKEVKSSESDAFAHVMMMFDNAFQNHMKSFPEKAEEYIRARSDRNDPPPPPILDDRTKALLVTITTPHIRRYLEAADPMALKQIETALGDLKPTPETYPETFKDDDCLPKRGKLNIERYIQQRFYPNFKADVWGKVIVKGPGGQDEYVVAGYNNDAIKKTQDLRLCFIVRVYSPFPASPDNLDVIGLDECKRLH